MPKIAKCLNDDCPLARICYRYMAEETPVESDCLAVPVPGEGEVCDYFMELKTYE